MWGLWAIAIIGLNGASKAHADRQLAAVDDTKSASDERRVTEGTHLVFDSGRVSLTASAKSALEPVVETLRTHNTLRIALVGHFTNARTQATAKRRAAVVKWYLVDAGIETDRIDTRVSAGAIRGDVIEVDVTSVAISATTTAATKRHDDLSPAADRSAEDASAMANLLTGDSGNRFGGSRRRGPSLARFWDGYGQHATIGVGAESGFRDEGSLHADIGHPGGLDLHLPAVLDSAPKRSEQAPSRGRSESPPFHSGSGTTLDATPITDGDIRDRIGAQYMAGMSQCYRKRLAADATLSGKIALVFTVDDTGQVLEPKATGVDPELAGCIRFQMTRWRFAVPRHRGLKTFSVSLVLRSS